MANSLRDALFEEDEQPRTGLRDALFADDDEPVAPAKPGRPTITLDPIDVSPQPSRAEQLGRTLLETRPEALSPRSVARKLPLVGPAIGGLLAGAEELGALTGSEALFELGSGTEMLSAEELARLSPEKRKAAERRQMPGLKAAALEAKDIGKGLAEAPGKIMDDPLGFVADAGTGAIESAIRTDARGGIRREAPISSAGDVLAIGKGAGALVPVAQRGMAPVTAARGRLKEGIGKGFGKRANEIEAADQAQAAKGLAKDATNIGRRAKALPEVSQAKKLKLQLEKARAKVKAIDTEFRAKNIHTKEAGEWATLEGRIFDAVKEVRRLDPEVQAATRTAWDARRGLGDFRQSLEHLLPEEQAKLFRTLDDEALRSVFDNKHTPAVEKQRGAMKGAQRKAATSEVAGAQKARGFLARLQKARRVEAQLEEQLAKATEKSLDAQTDILGRHVDADAKAQTALADADEMATAVKALPETSTSSWLRRFAKASPGEKNLLDESAVGLGGGGLKGMAAGIVGKIAGDWANDAAAMNRVASSMIKRGRSMQQTQQWADVIGPALKSGGTAGGITAVRGLMEAGKIEPDAAAEIVQAIASARSTEEQARNRPLREVLN